MKNKFNPLLKSGIQKLPDNLTDIDTRSHTALTDIGTSTHGQIDTHLGLTALNSHGATATADIDFAKYKAIAMVCDNGATLPSTPTAGQWYLHTPTGRTVLMQYNGTSWSPIFGMGTSTMYVDGLNGTNSGDNGFGTTTDAFATIQYALNQCPLLAENNITINIAKMLNDQAISSAFLLDYTGPGIDEGSFTDYTTEINNGTANDVYPVPAAPAVNDAFYFGYTSTFCFITLNIGTAGVGTYTISWEYWNGSAWTAITGANISDEPTKYTVSGTGNITFIPPSSWAQNSVNGTTRYWIKARVSAFTSMATRPIITQGWVTRAYSEYITIPWLIFKAGTLTLSGDSLTQVAVADNTVTGSTATGFGNQNFITALMLDYTGPATDQGAFTNYTTALSNATIDDVLLIPATEVVNDAFYFGMYNRFGMIKLNISTAGVGNAITWEYWNGAWVALTCVDNTSGFTVSGTNTITWNIPTDWLKNTVNSTSRYWIKARVSAANYTTQPKAAQGWCSGTYGYIENTAASWPVDAYKHKLLKNPAGVSIPIVANSATVIEFVDQNWVRPSGAQEFTIWDWSDVVRVQVPSGGAITYATNAVATIQDVYIYARHSTFNGASIGTNARAVATLIRCFMYGYGYGGAISIGSWSQVYTQYCIVYGSDIVVRLNGPASLLYTRSSSNIFYFYSIGGGNYKTGVAIWFGSNANFNEGDLVTGVNSSGTKGVLAYLTSGSSVNRLFIENFETGLDARGMSVFDPENVLSGMAFGAVATTFFNCTTWKSPSGASDPSFIS